MTKKAELISILKKPFGAKRETIMAKLGWQEHSVRGQISLLKKDGYVIVGTKGANGFVYKIMASDLDKDEQASSDTDTAEQAINNTIEEQTTSDNIEEQVL